MLATQWRWVTIRVALLSWGDLIEDFLDSIGVQSRVYAMSYGADGCSATWMHCNAPVEPEVVCVSARIDKPVRWRHVSTQAPIWLLPASRSYRSLRKRLADPYAWSTNRALGDVARSALATGTSRATPCALLCHPPGDLGATVAT